MYSVVNIHEDLVYLGVNDRRLELFENIFPIKNGVTYNSYLLLDEKTVLLDTVDGSALKQFRENLTHALNGRSLDYIIVNHVEPDHAETLSDIISIYPEVTVVGNLKTFNMLKQFCQCAKNTLTVKEGDVLDCGKHKLSFYMAPMVHWPEVMLTYDETSKTLFSADAFGTFGALDGRIFADEYDFDRDFLDEARRYYTNIVGKYGAQVLAVLKKLNNIEVDFICPLHGPVWRKDLGYFIEKHQQWASYTPENPDEILIAYTSMYGNTESAVNALAVKLSAQGKKVKVMNACNTDKSFIISETFRVGTIILAAPTYNGEVYPTMDSLARGLRKLNLQNRRLFVVENGSWGAVVGRKLTDSFAKLKNIEVKAVLTIRSSLDDEGLLDEFVEEVLSV